MHPSKSEIATTDTTGLMKCWSLVEITSALNNNEAVTTDSQYTWSCTFQSWRSNEAITMVRYGYDSSVYAVATINAINLFDANTHALVSTFASSPTREAIRYISFFDHSSLLLVVTPHSLYTMDLLSKQVLWLLLVDVTKVAVNASGLTDRPLFAVTLHNTPETDSILILSPESSTPVASVTLNAHVEAMCWGKESIRSGRRVCLFCLTDRREIIKIVEGEAERVELVGDEVKKVTAFDEVFDVDKVEEMAETMKRTKNYSRAWSGR